jgi:hypothetical protein
MFVIGAITVTGMHRKLCMRAQFLVHFHLSNLHEFSCLNSYLN